MDINQKILSDLTVYMKYAKYKPELKRRENWNELVDRNKEMHIKKFPELRDEIESAYEYVYHKKVMPSMRSMQFAGKPIEINPTRIFNCSYLPIDHPIAFSEIMFLLLSGTGVGFSVQKHHVDELPEINKPKSNRTRRWLIGDSIEGWSDAIKILMKSYFNGGPSISFDYNDIRPKGTRLITSGGKAPGPQPLKECLVKIEGALEQKNNGEKLRPIEVHDIVCHIADAVLAGGIRRAALISLFSFDDDEMISCKTGNWWELNPQRGRSNNSAVILRSIINKKDFIEFWKRIELSHAGEPGIYFSNDKDLGTNPCVETSLRPFQYCNLTDVNVSDIESQCEFENRCRAAAFIGTLQATYTDFHYLRPIWKRNTEKDALIGVGMTGIGSGKIFNFDLVVGAEIIKSENERIANIVGINKAARCTVVKPAGTSSLVLGTSSGIHAWYNEHYIRRIRILKNDSLYTYLKINHSDILEDEYFRPHDTAVISIPQKSPEGSIHRNEYTFDLLNRIKNVYENWVLAGHRQGINTHNVSATVSVKDDEWTEIGNWVWDNRNLLHGLAFLPFDGGSYVQAPFEDITEEQYISLSKSLSSINFDLINEIDDNTNLTGELACSSGVCEII